MEEPWDEEVETMEGRYSPPQPPTEEAADGGPPPCWEQPPEPASEIHPRNLAVAFSPVANLRTSPMPPPHSTLRRASGTAKKRRLPCVSNSVRFVTASGERVAQPMQVVLRIRPIAVKNAPGRWDEKLCIHATSNDTIAIAAPEGSQGYRNGDRGQTYTFSQVFGPEVDQPSYFEATALPMVLELAHSQTPFNSVMMAYGITASGKTHTIEGSGANPGVLPRALDLLFKAKDDTTSVSVSHYEVYNEQVYDLLAEGRAALKVKENSTGHIFISGLSKQSVSSTEAALGVMHRGSRHRQRAGTALNQKSSRSHTIFTICLSRVGSVEVGEGEGVDAGEAGRLGTLSFVDLAGAERANRTGNAGKRLKESVSINSSLMTLGRCMEALRWNQRHPEGEPKLVPYRESKVTHIFRDVLHGWGRLVLSVCVSPNAADYDETHRVLKYAQLATQISQLSRAEAPNRVTRNQAPACAGPNTASKRRRLGEGPLTARKGCPPTAVRGGVRQSLAGGPPPDAAVIRQMAETIQSMEEVVLDLRAENKELQEKVEQLEEARQQQEEATGQEIALTEARVRDEVSEDMKELLAKMEARYKERELEMREQLDAQHQQALAAAVGPPGESGEDEVVHLRSRCMELEEELQGKVDELLEKEEAWSNERATVEAELTTAALAAEEYWKAKLTQHEANTAAEITMLRDEAEQQAEVSRANKVLRVRVQQLAQEVTKFEHCSCQCAPSGTPQRRPSGVGAGEGSPRLPGGGTPHSVALRRAQTAVATAEKSAAVARLGTPRTAGWDSRLSLAHRDADVAAGEQYASIMASTELFSRLQSASVALADAPPSALKGLQRHDSPVTSEEASPSPEHAAAVEEGEPETLETGLEDDAAMSEEIGQSAVETAATEEQGAVHCTLQQRDETSSQNGRDALEYNGAASDGEKDVVVGPDVSCEDDAAMSEEIGQTVVEEKSPLSDDASAKKDGSLLKRSSRKAGKDDTVVVDEYCPVENGNEGEAVTRDGDDDDAVLVASPHEHGSPDIGGGDVLVTVDEETGPFKTGRTVNSTSANVVEADVDGRAVEKGTAESAQGQCGSEVIETGREEGRESVGGDAQEAGPAESSKGAENKAEAHPAQKGGVAKRQSSRRSSRLLAELAWSLPVDESQYYATSSVTSRSTSAADSSLMAAAKMVAASGGAGQRSVSSRRRSTRLAAAAVSAPLPETVADVEQENPAHGRRKSKVSQPLRGSKSTKPQVAASLSLAPITEDEEAVGGEANGAEVKKEEAVLGGTEAVGGEEGNMEEAEEEKENGGKVAVKGGKQGGGRRRTRRLGPTNALLALNSDLLDNSPQGRR